MSFLVDTLSYAHVADNPGELLAAAALRVTLVLLVALCIAVVLRRASAAVRHRVYGLALVATLVVPIVWAAVPAWPVAVVEAEPAVEPVRGVAVSSGQSIPMNAPRSIVIFRPAPVAPAVAIDPLPSGERPRTADDPLEEPASAEVTSREAASPMAPPVDVWRAWGNRVVALWLTGVLVGLVYIGTGVVSAWCLLRRTEPVRDGDWLADLNELSVKSRIRGVSLVSIERSMSPVAWGWLRPRVVVPRESFSWSAERRRSVLLHELAHVSRGDWWWQMLSNVVVAVWWFHPLVWLVAVQLRKTSEEAADDFVVTAGQAPARYAEELLSIASSLARTRWMGPAQAMFRSPKLEARLRAILDPRRNRRLLSRKVSLATLAVALAAIVPLATLTPTRIQAEPAAAANKQGEGKAKADAPVAEPKGDTAKTPAALVAGATSGTQTQRLLVRVLAAETGKPVAKADLRIRARAPGKQLPMLKQRFTLKTNEQGEAVIEFPASARLQSFTLDTKAAGLVPQHLYWSGEHKAIAFPEDKVIRLQPATTIGGVVQDAAGKPIAGAEVVITYPATESDMKNYYYHLERGLKTDEGGRWSSSRIPHDMTDMGIRIKHPDFIEGQVSALANRSKLLEKQDVLTLHGGPQLAGQIVDEQGKPLAGAEILLGTATYDQNKRETRSDAEGRFALKNCKPGPSFVTVQHPTHAPELQRVDIAAENDPLTVQLGAPGEFHLKLVNAEGQPIVDAEVCSEFWRGQQTLRVRRKVDGEGRCDWTNAPRDSVKFSILAGAENLTARDVMLSPSSKEQVVKIHPRFAVSGTVVDAETGKPIDKFQVFSAFTFNPKPQFDRYNIAEFAGGRFEYKFHEFKETYALLVEAEGYEPAGCEPFKAQGHPSKIEFKLKPRGTINGLVLQPDGKPAAGATVVLLSSADRGFTQISNGQFRDNPNVPSMKTGADGSYKFNSQSSNYQLVALHDAGYRDVLVTPSGKAPDLQLKPWGRIEGTLKFGERVGADQQMRYSPKVAAIGNQHRLSHDYETKTDAQGKFTIERVVPGEGHLSPMCVTSHVSSWTHTPLSSELIRVKPDETIQVSIGGMGRPVIGKAIARKPDGSLYTWEDNELARAYTQQPGGTKYFNLQVAKDGTFRGEDLPAGDYQFSLNLTPPATTADRQCGFGNSIGSASMKFTIPEMPDGRSDEPLDIGEVPINLFKFLNVGDVAPNFALDTLDGKTVSLAELRGKVVLVDFWATWCGPCLAEMPNMKSVYDEFRGNPNFAMLGVSIDEKIDLPRSKAEVDGYAWTQLWAKGGWQGQVAQDYGVRGIPATFLIGPDGKVVAKDLRGEAVGKAVRAALESVK
jgi:beta-lactamase regulating signal transducer with metallopeptidase domain/peroxiredoxin